MEPLVRTNDPVLIATVQAMLAEAGIPCVLLDSHISVLEGSIGAFPRRLAVPAEWLAQARRLMAEAGLGHELADGR
jgi:hypothetical protein